MKLRRDLGLALVGLLQHKLRSLLSMLGVIFGVAAVVAMLSIGEGARREAMRKYGALGVDNILIREPPLSEEERQKLRAEFSSGLSMLDAEAIREILPGIAAVAPQREIQLDARYRDQVVRTTVVGTVPEYRDLLSYAVDSGEFFGTEELRQRSRVCVLGSEMKRRLFPLEEALGRQVKLADQWFRVIGVMRPKGMSIESAGVAAFRDLDRDVYVPLTTALDRLEPPPVFWRQSRRGPVYRHPRLLSEIQQITLQVEDRGTLRETAAVARRILLRRHHGNEDFQILIPEVLLAQERKDQRIFDLVLASIAGISLLVGGIGIMNIMLASVLERTREIGIRLAVGARRRDILGQFVVEASLISFMGGLLGILMGFAMAFVIDRFADFRAAVSPLSILVAFFVSVAVGLIFGIYPASQASKLNPIEAVRHE